MTNHTTASLQLSSEDISRNLQLNSSTRFTSYSDSKPDRSSYICNAVDFVLHSVFQVIFLACGLAGNSLSMLIFAKTKPHTPTAFLLIWLGVCDNVVLVIYFLMTGISPICRFYAVCPYFVNVTLPTWKTMVWPVGTMSSMAVTMLVVCLSYHRFIGACYPHRSARLASITVARYQVTVIISSVVVFNLPRFLDDYAHLPANSTEMILKSTALGNDYYYKLVYAVIIYYFVAFFVPFVLLIFMTYKLIGSLRNFYRNRDHVTTGTSRDEAAVTRALVVIVIMFMVTQVLNPIRRFLAAVLPERDTNCGSFYYYFNILSTLGVSFESSIHFTLYCLFDKRFRRQLKHWMRPAASNSTVTPTAYG